VQPAVRSLSVASLRTLQWSFPAV